MLIGVVSDTHNNLKNIHQLISLFNAEEVNLVIHTGDIANSNSLEKFSELNADLIGVYGNNDRNEVGLTEVANKYNFQFQEPPNILSLCGKKIAIFHEPDSIDSFLIENDDIDIVIHGHTHRYRNEEIKGVLFFNPGESAGMQKGKNAIGLVNLNDLEIKRIFF
ncbi:YfcE family phosphodiesterase [Gammaproteobacteria bacterium]|nr:YfcE family phosphodiesterase [Gammaproteobacteria bacterium]MDC1251207.1 YfcE family phosphodiesterase [Gammaproteobacteria bacterium]